MRLPVIGNISTKDGSSNKNARMTNMLAEEKQGKSFAAIRPGLSQVATGSGDGNNLVCFNGNLINIYGNTVYRAYQSGIGIETEDFGGMTQSTAWRLAYGNNVFVGTPLSTETGKKFAISSDGINWDLITIPSPYSNGQWLQVHWNGSQFLALDRAFSYYGISADGENWSFGTYTGMTYTGMLSGLSGLAWNGSVYCTTYHVSSTHTPTSPDGITWTSNVVAYPLYGIASNGSIFCAVRPTIGASASNKAYTSSDGATWTERTLPYTDYWSGIIWNGAEFCATGQTYSATSNDGITWSGGTMPSAGAWYSVAYLDGYYLAPNQVSGGKTIAISSNGISWESKTISNSGYWNQATSGIDGFVMADFLSSATDKISLGPIYSFQNIGTVTDNFFDFALIP